MTYVSDLYLNRCPSGYILEWFFEELHPKAKCCSVTLDDELTFSSRHNLADQVNGYYPYRSSIFIRPRKYVFVRTLHIRLYDAYFHETPCREIEKLSIVNFPRHMTMTERYD